MSAGRLPAIEPGGGLRNDEERRIVLPDAQGEGEMAGQHGEVPRDRMLGGEGQRIGAEGVFLEICEAVPVRICCLAPDGGTQGFISDRRRASVRSRLSAATGGRTGSCSRICQVPKSREPGNLRQAVCIFRKCPHGSGPLPDPLSGPDPDNFPSQNHSWARH